MSDARILWVGNLHPMVDNDLLHELLINAGPIANVSIPFDKNLKRPKSFAFVTYRHEQSVAYAMQLFRDTSLYGKPLLLDRRTGVHTSKEHFEDRPRENGRQIPDFNTNLQQPPPQIWAQRPQFTQPPPFFQPSPWVDQRQVISPQYYGNPIFDNRRVYDERAQQEQRQNPQRSRSRFDDQREERQRNHRHRSRSRDRSHNDHRHRRHWQDSERSRSGHHGDRSRSRGGRGDLESGHRQHGRK